MIEAAFWILFPVSFIVNVILACVAILRGYEIADLQGDSDRLDEVLADLESEKQANSDMAKVFGEFSGKVEIERHLDHEFRQTVRNVFDMMKRRQEGQGRTLDAVVKELEYVLFGTMEQEEGEE